MRLLTLFFACYFAVLGCLSCAVEEERSESVQVATIQSAPAHHPQPAADWCSPLCQCHCCAGFAMPQTPALVFNGQPTPYEAAKRFSCQPVSAVPVRSLATPWQPPQVA